MTEIESTFKVPKTLPLIPLRDLVVFPNLVVPLFVGREKSMLALEESMKANHLVVLVTQKEAEVQEPEVKDLYKIGCAVTIMQELKLPDGTAKALVEGITRVKIKKIAQKEPYLTVDVEELVEKEVNDIEAEAMMRTLMEQFERATELGKPIPREVLQAAQNIDSPGRLADFIAFHLNLKTEERQAILEAVEPKKRLEKVSRFLNRELEIYEIGSKIQSRVKEQMDKAQREYVLKEQLKAIQKELGMMDEQQAEADELREKVKEARMPAEVGEKAEKEIERLSRMYPGSAEINVVRTYLDWLVSLPWEVRSEEKLNLKKAQEILDKEHYGLKKVKERVVEYLAVHKLTKGRAKGSILCFTGPPGTGKTSIGQSIAHSLGRKFIRVSLGGVRDEAEIRGHRRTYVGALPGRIMQAISQIKTKNPVFMLDEIDKIGIDFRGDPSSALLEVLDPEQNYMFSDHYLEVPFDLSEVLFITTANILDTIPPALKDRMEVIHFAGYTEDEKVNIAEKYLIPKQLKAHGLTIRHIIFQNEAIRLLIREHTREAGVRNLERQIASVCRQIARKVVEGEKKKSVISGSSLNKYLGPPQFAYGTAEEKDEIGMATGLAWTETGGDIMFVEAGLMKGKGELILTGSLGDVMRESARAAVSYIRANASKFKINPDFYKNYDIHLHMPAAAIPKDGPSAGITMATALVSALTKSKVRKDIAMTGEITLRGHVLPIGGLKEKALAAHRAGIRKVVIPKANNKDLVLIPEHVRKELEFIEVEFIEDVVDVAFAKPAKKKSPKTGK